MYMYQHRWYSCRVPYLVFHVVCVSPSHRTVRCVRAVRMWAALRKAALVLLIVVFAAPLFYEPKSRERIYPLKVIASEAQMAYKAANEAAQGARNLTATEHVITGLLAPAVLVRARGSAVEDYEALLLRAIPLMSCGPTKGQCDPKEAAWWKQLTNLELALVSSWIIVFCVRRAAPEHA